MAGCERFRVVTVRFVMLDVPLDPMPEWSRKSSAPLCSSVAAVQLVLSNVRAGGVVRLATVR